MKQIFLLLTLSLFLNSCWIGPGSARKKMNKEVNKAYAGMTIADFKNELPDAMLVEMKQGASVYSIMKTFMRVGDTTNYPIYKFYYFKNGLLTSINEGKRATDYKIELEKTIKIIE